MNIDGKILSINPFWYGADREVAGKIVALQNDPLAELCAATPDRFGGFDRKTGALVPTQRQLDAGADVLERERVLQS